MLSWYELGKKEQMEPEQSSLERCIEISETKSKQTTAKISKVESCFFEMTN